MSKEGLGIERRVRLVSEHRFAAFFEEDVAPQLKQTLMLLV